MPLIIWRKYRKWYNLIVIIYTNFITLIPFFPWCFCIFIHVWHSSFVHTLLLYQFVYIPHLNNPLCATHLQGILTCHWIDLARALASEHFQTIEQHRQTSSYMASVTPRQRIVPFFGTHLKKESLPSGGCLGSSSSSSSLRGETRRAFNLPNGPWVQRQMFWKTWKAAVGHAMQLYLLPKTLALCPSSCSCALCVCVGRVWGICA